FIIQTLQKLILKTKHNGLSTLKTTYQK
ncbi:hypothetical protein MIMGU_mgv1a0204512mg, partial [Erythranthe guttata]